MANSGCVSKRREGGTRGKKAAKAPADRFHPLNACFLGLSCGWTVTRMPRPRTAARVCGRSRNRNSISNAKRRYASSISVAPVGTSAPRSRSTPAAHIPYQQIVLSCGQFVVGRAFLGVCALVAPLRSSSKPQDRFLLSLRASSSPPTSPSLFSDCRSAFPPRPFGRRRHWDRRRSVIRHSV